MNSKTDNFSNEEINKILQESKSFREVLFKIGYNTNGSGGYSLVKQQLKKRNILIPRYHYYGKSDKTTKYSLNEILIENSQYTNRAVLKKRLIKEGLLEYKCKCGNTGIWKRKKLSLQLEHKNGINNDNRLENLEFLCPNCHSQSKTFAGKNNKCSIKKKRKKLQTKRINYCSCGAQIKNRSYKCQKCHYENLRKIKIRPNYDELINLVSMIGYTATGKKYGVSDNTIRKWIKNYENVSIV